jgi:hypothetical protein
VVTCFLVSVATVIWLLAIKPKSVTLAFDRLIREAGFAFCSRAAFVFFRVPLFSSDVFLLSPFIFLGCLFFIRCLFVKPLYIFGGASFFIECISVKPLCIF